MVELIARDTINAHRWRRRLVPGQSILVGRKTATFPVYWDKQVSSNHAQVQWDGEQLVVRKVDQATNPIFFQTRPETQFTLKPGQHFVIGHTEFTLVANVPGNSPDHASPHHELTLLPEEIRKSPFVSEQGKLELLTELVAKLTQSSNHEQLAGIALQYLLKGIPQASQVLLLEQVGESFETVARDCRDPSAPLVAASQSLIQKSIDTENCILHVWQSGAEPKFTQVAGQDWAICIPIRVRLKQTAAIYLTGLVGVEHQETLDLSLLKDDIKFSELVGSTFGNLSRNAALEQRQSQLKAFFPPGLLERFSNDLESRLQPREAELVVMFCDLRGFSSAAEDHIDRLFEYLQQTSATLSEITSAILDHQGVIGDFHGDAVMGFWGWPDPLESNAAAHRAAQSIFDRLGMSKLLTSLSSPKIGIGIASGRAVAGMIGSRDQVKVTSFGPPVNLASRLEGLTKQLRIPLLFDENTAARFAGFCDVMPLGWYQLAGLKRPTQIFTCLDHNEGWANMFRAALVSFQRGDWFQAQRTLHEVPESFHPRNVLIEFMQTHKTPPADWNGIITMAAKR